MSWEVILKRWSFGIAAVALMATLSPGGASAAEDGYMHVLVSPIIAHDFWKTLNEIAGKGVTITPSIAQELCASLVAGDYRQCRRIRVSNPVPFQSGPGNTVAIRDGADERLIDGQDKAWVTLDYYIAFVNRTRRNR